MCSLSRSVTHAESISVKGVRSACRAFGRAGLPAVPAVCWKGGLRSVGLPPLLPRRPADRTLGVRVGCLFCSLGLFACSLISAALPWWL